MMYVNPCGQTIDISHLEKLKSDLQDQLDEKSTFHTEALTKATQWSNEIKEINTKKQEYNENKQKIERFEHLTQLIDTLFQEHTLMLVI